MPYIGPILGGVPPVVEAFVTKDPATALVIIGIYLLVLLVEGYLVFPLVIGRNMEINATTVMIACLFWWLVWGEIGLFLALPLVAGIKAICQYVPGWRPWANLMGMEPLEPGHRGRLGRLGAWLMGPVNRFIGPDGEPTEEGSTDGMERAKERERAD